MSGSAGLAAAKRRRMITTDVNRNGAIEYNQTYENLHPAEKLKLHEKKLGNMIVK